MPQEQSPRVDPEMRIQPDEAQGLAELSVRMKIPVDRLPLRRETDVGREDQLRAAAKGKLLAMMAGVTTEQATAGPYRPAVTTREHKAIDAAQAPIGAEVSGEVLAECLRGLEADYQRGIVVIGDKGTLDIFRAALEEDKTAGITWQNVLERLEADDKALLEKAAKMQGRGQLIGVYPDGKLCIKDRGNEPVIFGQDKAGNKVKITTDTPNRAELIERVKKEGQFADYWEIRKSVSDEGFELPPDLPNYEKKGLVAAVEAVTGEDFVRSANGKEWRSAILECGGVSRSSDVRVVRFGPYYGGADVGYVAPEARDVDRGAVRVLRG